MLLTSLFPCPAEDSKEKCVMPNLGDKEYNRALDALESGDLTTALEATESALMANAQDGEYWQLYSLILTHSGRAEDAAKAMEKAQEFGLDEITILLTKAAEAAAGKNWNKAVTACEKAIELAPERGEIWASYAAHLLDGDYQKDALEASEKAVELSPTEPHFWCLRGRVLRFAKKNSEALEAFEKTLALDNKLPLAWYEKGMIHHLEQEPEKAKACFLEAKQLQPDDSLIDEALAAVGSSTSTS